MAMTDAEVAMACNKWLAETKMPGKTIFADVDVLLDQFILLQNPQTKRGVDDLPRVEVQFMPVQPQQLTLGIKPEIVNRHLIGDTVIGGGTARRQFVYVATVVAKSQGYQYGGQQAADILARRFLFGTRLQDAPALWVRAPVKTGPGYQDETEWRVPVTINLETLAKI